MVFFENLMVQAQNQCYICVDDAINQSHWTKCDDEIH